MFQEPTQAAPAPVLIQSIQAWQPAQEQNQDGFRESCGWNMPFLPMILDGIHKPQQSKYFLPIE
jgi:hypothetical protein